MGGGGGGVDNLSLGWRGEGANIKNINKPWKGGGVCILLGIWREKFD